MPSHDGRGDIMRDNAEVVTGHDRGDIMEDAGVELTD